MSLRIWQTAAAAAGTAICFFLDTFAGIAMLLSLLIIFILQYISEKNRRKKILDMCDEIDKILRGAESVSFDEFDETELSILASEIHKMTVRLREQNHMLKNEKTSMKDALEDMSHQLRTPLTTMTLINEILKNPELPRREQTAHIREMSGLLSQMQWIVETMLKISRLEAEAAVFRKERFKVEEMIKESAEPLAISLELKNITLKTEIEGAPEFYADRKYCAEALINILKNCMEHTPEGGIITVKAVSNPIYDGIIISDTGSGFPEEMLPHIFERFYRDDKKSGYGIGLCFARSVIVSQNGSLQAFNNTPCGAVFDWRMFRKTGDPIFNR